MMGMGSKFLAKAAKLFLLRMVFIESVSAKKTTTTKKKTKKQKQQQQKQKKQNKKKKKKKKKKSQTLMIRTQMARLPWLIRTHF